MTSKLFSNVTDDAGAVRIVLLDVCTDRLDPDFLASTLWLTAQRRGNAPQKDVFSFKRGNIIELKIYSLEVAF